MVHLPAVNTPQFAWLLSRLPAAPATGAPDLRAGGGCSGAILGSGAADQPRRREYWVGNIHGRWTILGNSHRTGAARPLPGPDRLQSRSRPTGPADHDRSEQTCGNPLDGSGGHDYGALWLARPAAPTARSPQAWLSRHRLAAAVGAGRYGGRCDRLADGGGLAGAVGPKNPNSSPAFTVTSSPSRARRRPSVWSAVRCGWRAWSSWALRSARTPRLPTRLPGTPPVPVLTMPRGEEIYPMLADIKPLARLQRKLSTCSVRPARLVGCRGRA